MLSIPGICTLNASITPSRFDNQRWSCVFPHRLRGQGLPCLRQLSLSSPTPLSSWGKCRRWARCPSGSVIQWHLTYIPPSLNVMFVPVHPTMPTDVCCWRDQRYPQECRTMAWPRCGPPGQSCGLPRLMPIDCNQAEETWRVSSALELDDSMQ